MEKRPYSDLNLCILVQNLFDIEGDELLGVAINYGDKDAFIEDIRELAVKKYGGATFDELGIHDGEGQVSAQAGELHDLTNVAKMLDEADQVLADDADEFDGNVKEKKPFQMPRNYDNPFQDFDDHQQRGH